MFNLIYKDMLLLRKTALFALVYELLFIFAFKEIPQLSLFAGIVGATYILVVTSTAYEDKNSSDIVLNSLPLSRNEIVMVKYIELFLFAVLAAAAFIIIASILRALNIDIGTININLEIIASNLFIVVLMNSLYFPVFFKFGYIKSKYVNFVLYFAFFFSIQTVVQSFANDEVGRFLGDILKVINNLSQNIVGLLILLATILVAAVSYSISISFYRAREF